MSRKKNSSCPFWSPSGRTCNIALEGLFIPPANHVEIYCKTPDHPLCAQYSGQMSEEVAFYSCIAERRLQQRIVSSHRISVIKPADADQEMPSHFVATTIDLSRGGLRFFAKKALTQEAVVGFCFDDGFPEQLRSGLAIIRWCLPQLNSSGYQVGLAFKDDASARAMASYLGQSRH